MDREFELRAILDAELEQSGLAFYEEPAVVGHSLNSPHKLIAGVIYDPKTKEDLDIEPCFDLAAYYVEAIEAVREHRALVA